MQKHIQILALKTTTTTLYKETKIINYYYNYEIKQEKLHDKNMIGVSFICGLFANYQRWFRLHRAGSDEVTAQCFYSVFM